MIKWTALSVFGNAPFGVTVTASCDMRGCEATYAHTDEAYATAEPDEDATALARARVADEGWQTVASRSGTVYELCPEHRVSVNAPTLREALHAMSDQLADAILG